MATIKQTLADLILRMVTAEDLLGKRKAIRLNRDPTNQDVYEDGQIFENISFGETTPLRYISIAPGVWAFQNSITLTKIRFNVSGRNTSYRSNLSNLRFFKSTGEQLPNSHFIWGSGSAGIGKGTTGVAYNGGTISSNYTSGWAELEVSSLFDTSITISKVLGNFESGGNFMSLGSVEFYYSNGSKKIYSGSGWSSGNDITACNVDPPLVCRFGDAISAAQGEMLTAAKLADPNDNTYGRISPAALNAAIQAIVSPTAKTPSQADFDLLVQRITELEAKVNV